MSMHERIIADMRREAEREDATLRRMDLGASPLDTQVGGNHYKKCKIQPIEYILANGLGYAEGNIIKYITRYKDKNGIEDLLKIKHYADLLINNIKEKRKNVREDTTYDSQYIPTSSTNACSSESGLSDIIYDSQKRLA